MYGWVGGCRYVSCFGDEGFESVCVCVCMCVHGIIRSLKVCMRVHGIIRSLKMHGWVGGCRYVSCFGDEGFEGVCVCMCVHGIIGSLKLHGWVGITRGLKMCMYVCF